jgi:ABC-type lipoprotein export system ATPase subunit
VQSEASSQIILAENLVKVYEAGKLWVTAVNGVSLSVEKGEFVAIVGPSGSGKSTLFYLLGGLTRATKGRVVIDGVDFATLDDGERTRLRKRRIGFVFQKFNLLPTLSAMGNIEIAYTISGRKEPMDHEVPGPLERYALDPGKAQSSAFGAERRRAAAGGHCARAGDPAGDRAGRRAHREPGHQELRCGAEHADALQPRTWVRPR